MKITYKYSRNNAQFLYDLSSTSSIDQLVRRLTGRQTVTNDNGEKEHVDPAFSVDEILIDSVEVFNRAEHETVYDNVDKLRAPWDDTENKELSDEDARKRNEDLTKAASLLKTYNDRFTELEKRLSLLPAEVRKIPNEFMSIGVNGFYRTVSISLGLNEYLDEISTDKEAFKMFNTAEEQNDALNNVMDVIDFLSKLDESAQELFNSEDQEDALTDDVKEASNGDQQDAPADDAKNAPNGDQQEADKEAPNDATEEASTEGQQDAPTEDQQEASTEGQQDDNQQGIDKNQQGTSTDDQQDADENKQTTPTADTVNASTDGQREASNSVQQNAPAVNAVKADERQQEADKPKFGVAVIDNLFASNSAEFLGEND